ncbi:MAG: exosortase A [Paucibacter sp.]|nr:exosortase A [Roseateles sp.]
MTVSLPPAWRRALPAFLLLVAAVFVLFSSSGLAMVDIWIRSETFAHAFLVPPIALWLAWRRRERLAACVPRPAPVVLLPMALVVLVWLLGELVAVNAATQFAFVALLVLAVPLVFGWQVARVIAFPLLFLFFCVPFGEFMTQPMMDWTADFTIWALQVSGIPVYRQGLHFVIPNGSWSVVEACSGVRYLIASVMVGTLFAYLNYRSTKRRVIFVVVATLLPIIANWLRAYMIVMLGYLSGNRLATGVDHIIYGWLFFGIVMFALFVLGMRWSEPDEAPAADGTAAPAAVAASSRPQMRAWLATVAGLCLMAGAAGAGARLLSATPVQLALTPPDLAAHGWTRVPIPTIDYEPHYDLPRAGVRAEYTDGQGHVVGVYVAYYDVQDFDSKLVSSSNVVLASNDKVWVRVSEGQADATPLGHLRTAQLHSANLHDADTARRLTVWRVYWVGGQLLTSDLGAKFGAALHRLLGQGDDSAVLILYTRDGDAPGDASGQLTRFVNANGSEILGWLNGYREQRHSAAR